MAECVGPGIQRTVSALLGYVFSDGCAVCAMSKGARNIDLCFTIFKEPISAIASVTLQTGGQVEAPPTELKIGAIMTDGTVYAALVGAHGHQDWRVPTKNELNVLFNNRAAIGGFDTTGWHWSSSPYILWFAWRQRFG